MNSPLELTDTEEPRTQGSELKPAHLTLEKKNVQLIICFRCFYLKKKKALLIVGVVRKDSERGFMENLRSWLNVLVFPLNGKMNGFSLNGEGLQDQF